MRDLVIYGTGGFAREVHQVVEDVNRDKVRFNVLGFLDDAQTNWGKEVHGLPVLGDATWLSGRRQVGMLVGIGAPSPKRGVVGKVLAAGATFFEALVHPLAWIGNRVQLGEGTIICAGVRITTDITIGRYVILNLDVTVGHDTVIDDFVTVAPSVNISGGARLLEGVDIGTNASLIPNVSIGAWSKIGAGAAVVRNVPEGSTVAGVPARPIDKRDGHR